MHLSGASVSVLLPITFTTKPLVADMFTGVISTITISCIRELNPVPILNLL